MIQNFTPRVFSGIQPSGGLTLGNYLGAMKRFVDMQDDNGFETVYCMVDLHAITVWQSPEDLRRNTRELCAGFIAAGIDPEKSILFNQSQVPEHAQLGWIFNCVARMGWMKRMNQWKDKAGKNSENASLGLFGYPALMAADILIYDSNIVPVGKDQKQHIEVTRDVAMKFNQLYGECFVIPEPQIKDDVAVVPGTDGQKMSKSYGNTIDIFGEEKPLKKKIMSLVMDSRGMDEPKPDAEKNIAVQLLKLVGSADVAQECEESLRAGGYGYGALKKALFENYWECFREQRAKRAELANNLDYVSDVLREGAEKAREIARPVLKRARIASGLE